MLYTMPLKLSPYIHTSQNFITFLLSSALLSHIPSEVEQTKVYLVAQVHTVYQGFTLFYF